MNTGKEYTIGILADLAEVNTQTVHYYERRRLLFPVKRTLAGYRLYNKNSLKQLLFIRRAKELGFTLEEIKGLLKLNIDSAGSCDSAKQEVVEKLRKVEKKIKDLGSLRTILNELLKSCDKRSPTETCPILKGIEVDLPGREKREK